MCWLGEKDEDEDLDDLFIYLFLHSQVDDDV